MQLRKRLFLLAALILTLALVPGALAAGADDSKAKTPSGHDTESVKNEVQHSLERGLRWLQAHQDPKGFWSQPDHPALTSLVLTAFMGEPTGTFKANPPGYIVKGYDYLLQCVQPDGGIYVKDLPNYNTSVSMMAFVMSFNPSFEKILRRARNFIVGLQDDFDQKGATDNPLDGGVGYGGSYQHSDLNNTMFALEALYYTKFLTTDKGTDDSELRELNWPAVVKFIERCQNLPGSNDQPWASDDPQNKGGFIYFPGDSKAGEMQLPSGKTALRSYGSISYAGLLSYIYTDLDREDPRVKAVYQWLAKNYSIEENPGMGQDGLYYYYHTMAKALSAYGVKNMVLENGQEINWRRDLAMRLINLQREDGSWVNEDGRWWQKDPALVTAFAVMTLEIVYKGL